MATYTIAAGETGAYEKALVASTVDTVTFQRDVDHVDVIGDGTTAIYFTLDGSTPTVAGATTLILPKGIAAVRTHKVPTDGNTVVKLISSGTPVYSVAESVG